MVLGVNKGWGNFSLLMDVGFVFAVLQQTSSSLRNAVGYIIKCTD